MEQTIPQPPRMKRAAIAAVIALGVVVAGLATPVSPLASTASAEQCSNNNCVFEDDVIEVRR